MDIFGRSDYEILGVGRLISEYTVNAYEKNQIKLYAVQGESDSRTIILNIIEKSGTIMPTSNAVPVNKMLNLTDYDIKLYVINSEVVSVDGEIISAADGEVQFILSSDCTFESGDFECAVILTKEDEDLRIVGLNLRVEPLDLNGGGGGHSNTQMTYPYKIPVSGNQMTVKTATYEEVTE